MEVVFVVEKSGWWAKQAKRRGEDAIDGPEFTESNGTINKKYQDRSTQPKSNRQSAGRAQASGRGMSQAML